MNDVVHRRPLSHSYAVRLTYDVVRCVNGPLHLDRKNFHVCVDNRRWSYTVKLIEYMDNVGLPNAKFRKNRLWEFVLLGAISSYKIQRTAQLHYNCNKTTIKLQCNEILLQLCGPLQCGSREKRRYNSTRLIDGRDKSAARNGGE